MKIKLIQRAFWGVILIIGTLMIITPSCDGGSKEKPASDDKMTEATPEPTKPPASDFAWRNAVNEPPPGYSGPVFELSDDYPQSLPAGDPKEMFPWLDLPVDFSSETVEWNGVWNDYIEMVKDYVAQGQDPNLGNEYGFITHMGGEAKWFHIPWMAYDPSAGREFTHGTTNERTASLGDFIGDDNSEHGVNMLAGDLIEDATYDGPGFETWAVGCYNDFGAYAVGQGWGQDGSPNLTGEGAAQTMNGLPYPEGTVVMKVLFTTATPDLVPYLEGSPVWDVNRHVIENNAYQCERQIQPVRLVQMDIAVVDHRSPTNWVFGTFAYNANLPGTTVWEKLSPVGLQWGMDGGSWPAVDMAQSEPIRESVIAPIDIYQHDGCYKRLAGPVDNPQSSCMSCHGGAYVPSDGQIGVMGTNIPSIFGFDGLCEEVSAANTDYFTTYKYPQKYPSGTYDNTVNLDFSLQMWAGMLQYANWNVNGQPDACTLGN